MVSHDKMVPTAPSCHEPPRHAFLSAPKHVTSLLDHQVYESLIPLKNVTKVTQAVAKCVTRQCETFPENMHVYEVPD